MGTGATRATTWVGRAGSPASSETTWNVGEKVPETPRAMLNVKRTKFTMPDAVIRFELVTATFVMPGLGLAAAPKSRFGLRNSRDAKASLELSPYASES